jgi:pre-mRNA-splicing factor SYF1
MLRIKRAVQASYNTENSFIAAQAAAARKGTEKPTDAAALAAKDAADPMAAMERSLAQPANGAVASTLKQQNVNGIDESVEEAVQEAAANPDAIAIEEDEF